MAQPIVLATGNPGKVNEFRALLKAPPPTSPRWGEAGGGALAEVACDLVAPPPAMPTVEETGLTFLENALIKARHAASYCGLPALADDSGLVVDALHGAPGIYSARYAGEGASPSAHIAKLLKAMESVPASQRQARFYCVMVYLRTPTDPMPLIGQGVWEGMIATAPRGQQGFGYDPIFWVAAEAATAAELAPDVKNRLSHRAKAWHQLRPQLLGVF